MYTTGKQLAPNTATDFRELDDIQKTVYRDGVLIGRRGENGHPHTGKYSQNPPHMASMLTLGSPMGFRKAPCSLLGGLCQRPEHPRHRVRKWVRRGTRSICAIA